MTKSKTLATWLAFVTGPLGGHRFYLHGPRDLWAWLLPLPTLLGVVGVMRARHLGLDDRASWVLIPLLGLMIAAGALTALVYGLTAPEGWNARHNPDLSADHAAGQTHWGTVIALIASLMVGATALISALAYSFQRYFELQI